MTRTMPYSALICHGMLASMSTSEKVVLFQPRPAGGGDSRYQYVAMPLHDWPQPC